MLLQICDIYNLLPYIEKLETTRDVLLSNYLMTKYGSGHSLELLKDGHEEEVWTTEGQPSVQVLGWRVVTVV